MLTLFAEKNNLFIC